MPRRAAQLASSLWLSANAEVLLRPSGLSTLNLLVGSVAKVAKTFGKASFATSKLDLDRPIGCNSARKKNNRAY
jgi:hypothetical protein